MLEWPFWVTLSSNCFSYFTEIITLSSEDEDEEKRKKNPSSLPKGSVPHPFVSMACRSLRIGTYRTNPSQRVVLSSDGLEMKVPLPSG